ncbi:oxidoreductase [Nocardiopsis sp. MG754419]|nr:oxidoreductase [Nocardiopsis sp. MG754419]
MNLSLDGTTVAVHRDGSDLDPLLSPRPFLHPVTTPAGTTVTELEPDDHRHHLGFGVAVPDVSGTSFWGGRTFTPDRGSVLLDNHGRQRHVRTLDRASDHHTAVLSWTAPDGRELIAEERTLRALPLDEDTWVLDVRTVLRNTSGGDLSIGSPATNGRPGAGYGGLFWRAPLGPRPPAVTGPDGLTGEESLHGARVPWLALAGSTAEGAAWTLLLHQIGAHVDPWFLRSNQYPGAGPALAWDRRLPVPADTTLERRLRVAVGDGHRRDLPGLAEAVTDLP